MKNYKLLKTEAIKLRMGGKSYGEIGKKLNTSKGTLSYWLHDVKLTEQQKKKFYTARILNLSTGAQSQKERRLREVANIIEGAKKEIGNSISLESYRLFGAALYWAEGNKKNNLGITNSDPHLILFMVKWFEKILGASPKKDLKAHLNIYPQQNENDIKQFWSQLTGIPLECFGKTFIKPINKNYKKNNLYYGTIKIKVHKGTDRRHKIFGWIKAVISGITPETELALQEWKKLTEVSRAINLPK